LREDSLSELPTSFAPYAQATEEASAEDAATSAIVLPDLPKGAALGNVIHSLLEKLPFSILVAGTDYETVLQRQCSWFGLEISAEKLATLLQKTVLTPLSGPDQIIPPFCLADLAPTDILQEMPFYCRLQSNSTEQINTLLAGLPTVAPVTAQALKGYLTGFMDLVCRHQGKFYIMDYKSNFLGRHLADYHPKRMEQAMRDHNYGLQYWLYTVMLHRYLHSSMEDYDYRRDFGGVLYLFVRGMEPAQPGSGVYYDRPDFATLENLDRCLGGKTVTSGRMN
jgi:exodeoxyribonuclease V beta subunit